MTRTYYENDCYICPRCGGIMLPSGLDNEWECDDCGITGMETWNDISKTGYVEVDIDEYEEILEQQEMDDEDRFYSQPLIIDD